MPGAPRSSRIPLSHGPAPSGPVQLLSPHSPASCASDDSINGRKDANDGAHECSRYTASNPITCGLYSPQAQDRNRESVQVTLSSDDISEGTQQGTSVACLGSSCATGGACTGRCLWSRRHDASKFLGYGHTLRVHVCVHSAYTYAIPLSGLPGEANRERHFITHLLPATRHPLCLRETTSGLHVALRPDARIRGFLLQHSARPVFLSFMQKGKPAWAGHLHLTEDIIVTATT